MSTILNKYNFPFVYFCPKTKKCICKNTIQIQKKVPLKEIQQKTVSKLISRYAFAFQLIYNGVQTLY